MSASGTSFGPARPGAKGFTTTHWSVVLQAGQTADPRAQAALERLCCAYWYPLYAYVRRSGHDPASAEDLTQEFFARLIAKEWLADADPLRGRFRTFLLTALQRFLVNEWHRGHCRKRGGRTEFVALDAERAEERFLLEPADAATPETLFERRWAVTQLDRALANKTLRFTVAPWGCVRNGITAANGTASVSVTIPANAPRGVAVSYSATFAGDAVYSGSTASGWISVR